MVELADAYRMEWCATKFSGETYRWGAVNCIISLHSVRFDTQRYYKPYQPYLPSNEKHTQFARLELSSITNIPLFYPFRFISDTPVVYQMEMGAVTYSLLKKKKRKEEENNNRPNIIIIYALF